jgi:hypothetical protein
MFANRPSYSLSKDQPILQQARRRRAHRRPGRQRAESDFWKLLSVEKLCATGAHAGLDRLPAKSNTAS